MRFNVEITNEKARNMKGLMKLLEISTQKELFNTALSVFEWVVNERIDGNVVASIVDAEKGEYKELVVPSLDTLWPRYNWGDLVDVFDIVMANGISTKRMKHFETFLKVLQQQEGIPTETLLAERLTNEEKGAKEQDNDEDILAPVEVSSAV